MEIMIRPTQQAATEIAARIVARLVREKLDAVLGLATRSTLVLFYQTLISIDLDWSRVRTFNQVDPGVFPIQSMLASRNLFD
jgi:glucosamine-6-phosphate deaminase